MKNNTRISRINDEIFKEVSQIVRGELKDPRIGAMTSVVRVDTTQDLKYCKVYVFSNWTNLRNMPFVWNSSWRRLPKTVRKEKCRRMQNNTKQEILEKIAQAKTIQIAGHTNPDGDAIGACLAFGLA